MAKKNMEMHAELRMALPAAYAELIDIVHEALTEEERAALPYHDQWLYLRKLVDCAMDRLDMYGEVVAKTIHWLYRQTEGQLGRFMPDPKRDFNDGSAVLYLDCEGQIVSIKGMYARMGEDGRAVPGSRQYQSYLVLTGPRAGETFFADERPLPEEPEYRRGAVMGVQHLLGKGKRPKVFLCHKREDRARVEAVARVLRQWDIDPWLDKDDIVPGSEWASTIEEAIERCDVVMPCITAKFNMAGYVKKELEMAGAAEARIVPMRLEECTPPKKLQKYQWIDFFAVNGYGSLVRGIYRAVDGGKDARPQVCPCCGQAVAGG